MHQAVKDASRLSYLLKPPSFPTQLFKENNKSHLNIFKHMCHFAEWSKCRIRRISVSSYIDVDIRKYQEHLLNPNTFDCITGYNIEYSVGDRALNNLSS